ncbi:MAG: hypothetical protein QF441_16130 [Bacteriovoracaceae bacterium]|jgi:hypothetical protein|nr:hypothetical protein [Bacteriovoracaceae bacterium]
MKILNDEVLVEIKVLKCVLTTEKDKQTGKAIYKAIIEVEKFDRDFNEVRKNEDKIKSLVPLKDGIHQAYAKVSHISDNNFIKKYYKITRLAEPKKGNA